MFEQSYTADEEAFRAELRRWLQANLPAEPVPDDEDARREFQRAWQRTLAAAGYVGIQWPKAHGGRGATLNELIIFTEEMARARAPEILDAVAVNIVGSVLIEITSACETAQAVAQPTNCGTRQDMAIGSILVITFGIWIKADVVGRLGARLKELNEPKQIEPQARVPV
jgi:hypothetical protein